MAENKESIFYCKQFSITQNQAVLKVNTESLLFGAMCAQYAKNNFTGQQNMQCMDIGAGTGLLSFMVAQQNEVHITAVEIEPLAYKLALQNALSCTFKHTINFILADIKTFETTSEMDFIFCNPPFFQNHLKSPQASRNVFLHNVYLDLETLAQCLIKHISKDGIVAILLPSFEMKELAEILKQYNFFSFYNFNIYASKQKPVLRQICFFKNEKTIIKEDSIVIKQENNEYTPAFKALLGAYYQIFE